MRHKETIVQQEFENVYKDIRSRQSADTSDVDGDFSSISIGTNTTTQNSFIEDCDGDLWIIVNASFTPSSCRFTRINANKAAWGLEMQGAGLFPGEIDSGWVVWRATGSVYGVRDISPIFGSVGGWELGMDITSNRDMVVGGGALEMDGFGSFPYGRLLHSTLSGRAVTGIGRNIYDSMNAHDSNSYPDMFMGWSSDTYKVQYGTAQVTPNLIDLVTISSNGYVNQPKQPSWLAYNSSAETDVTGDGTVVTVDFDTERFDQTNNFAADTFTAPITGRYLLSYNVYIKDTAAGNKCESRLITSNQTYTQEKWPTSHTDDNHAQSVVADMDAGDTARVDFLCSGGAKVVDILATSIDTSVGVTTFFSGSLLN